MAYQRFCKEWMTFITKKIKVTLIIITQFIKEPQKIKGFIEL